MFWRAVRTALGCGLVAGLALPACGGDSSSDAASGGSGGAAGGAGRGSGIAGKAGRSEPVPCGKKTCNGLSIPQLKDFDIPGCCADAATGRCGLDSSVLPMFGQTFGAACQPLAQPGTRDASCGESPEAPVTGALIPLKFPGCCQANGTCGYDLDSIGGLITLGLGCVDSTPFLDGGVPTSCGAEGGRGGAGP